jgi:hypothetical protein
VLQRREGQAASRLRAVWRISFSRPPCQHRPAAADPVVAQRAAISMAPERTHQPPGLTTGASAPHRGLARAPARKTIFSYDACRRLVLVGFGNYVTSASKRALLAGEPEPGRCMLEVTWDRWRDGAEPRWPRSSNSPGYRSPWPPCSRSAVTALIVAPDPEVRLRLHPTLRSVG